PSWISMALTTSELDFATMDYKPTPINNNAELMALLEKSLADAKAHLEKANEEQLSEEWILRSGDKIFSRDNKAGVIRMSFCQVVHHRAQLGVFLRLLN